MNTQKRKRRTKVEAEILCKHINDLLLDNEIPAIAKTLNITRQLVQYYESKKRYTQVDLQVK